MSKQCLDIQQMKHLQELGLDTSNASMYWVRLVRLPNVKKKEKEVLIDWFLDLQKEHMHVGYDEYECLPTFTLQDILDLLPTEIIKENRNYQLEVFREPQRYFVSYYWCDNLLISLNELEFIDAAYEMLCWCIENGYVKTNNKD